MSNLVENTKRGIRVDEQDEQLLIDHLFHITIDGYARTNVKRKGIFLHKLLMPESTEVDHINRDKLDNRRNNLRYVLHQENSMNRQGWKNSASKYKGVSKHGTSWRAIITVEGRRIVLGTFTKQEEAAEAYNIAAIKYHGSFAFINKLGDTHVL